MLLLREPGVAVVWLRAGSLAGESGWRSEASLVCPMPYENCCDGFMTFPFPSGRWTGDTFWALPCSFKILCPSILAVHMGFSWATSFISFSSFNL